MTHRFNEQALTFGDAPLTRVSVLHQAELPQPIGIVMLAGAPQSRIGSHRQFVNWARALAEAGFSVLRFDPQGRGDSGGEGGGDTDSRDFAEDQLPGEIRLAIDTLLDHCPTLGGVVLFGLCDGASAAILTDDTRIRGRCLLNPWAYSAQTDARSRLRDYYVKRLLNPRFWSKLLRGRLAVRQAAMETGRAVKNASQLNNAANNEGSNAAALPSRLKAAMDNQTDSLIILSGKDRIASQFRRYVLGPGESQNRKIHPSRRAVLEIPQADHTFTDPSDHQRVTTDVIKWLERLIASR